MNSNTTFGSGGGADGVVVGTLVVVVTTVGLEVTTVVSLLVVVAGTDVVVSGITVLEAVLIPVVNTFGGFVVDAV